MKKHLLKIALLAFTFASAERAEALVSFGLKAGIGVNSLEVQNTSGVVETGTTFGLGNQFGLSADFGLGVIGVSVDALYATRGQFLAVINNTWKELLVPVQAKFALLPFLSIGAGAYYSMALGDITVETLGVETGTLTFDAAGISGSDYGLVAGVGLGIPLGITTLSIEGRYLYGLKNRQNNATGDASAKSSAFDMLVGFTF